MNDRIKELRKSLDMTQDDFAQKIGLARNSIANYEIGRRIPSNAVITSICREFSVNEEWLRTGEGEMFNIPEDKMTAYAAQIVMGDDEFIKNIISVYMELDQTSKDALRKLAKNMAEKIKNKEQT